MTVQGSVIQFTGLCKHYFSTGGLPPIRSHESHSFTDNKLLISLGIAMRSKKDGFMREIHVHVMFTVLRLPTIRKRYLSRNRCHFFGLDMNLNVFHLIRSI